MRNKREAPDGRDALVERLREFIRLNYITAADIGGESGPKIRRSIPDSPVKAGHGA
jgi:hypothetical protein